MWKIDLTGKRFGRLLVLGESGKVGEQTAWKCKCDCGGIAIVTGANLRSGNTNSCGCLNRENLRKALTKHGATAGKKKPRLYRIWLAMRERCKNQESEKYSLYGGRGIKVCPEWEHDFQSFRDWALGNGYRDNLTLDREDNDGPYSPENCRWVTMKVQNRNKRSNHYLTYKGETISISEWAERCGIPYYTLKTRIRNGWSTEKALETAVRGRK